MKNQKKSVQLSLFTEKRGKWFESMWNVDVWYFQDQEGYKIDETTLQERYELQKIRKAKGYDVKKQKGL